MIKMNKIWNVCLNDYVNEHILILIEILLIIVVVLKEINLMKKIWWWENMRVFCWLKKDVWYSLGFLIILKIIMYVFYDL